MLTREYLESLMKEPVLSEKEPMLTRDYLESLMKEQVLTEEEPMLTREHLVWVMKELVLSGIASSARHASVVSESGHPRANAAHASLLEHQGKHPRHNQGSSNLYATYYFKLQIFSQFQIRRIGCHCVCRDPSHDRKGPEIRNVDEVCGTAPY